MKLPALLIGLLLGLVACQRGQGGVHEDEAAIVAKLRQQGHLVNASLGGHSVRYLGFVSEPAVANPGDTVALTHYWACDAALPERYDVFVHFLVEGASGWVQNGDHAPPLPTDAWRPGDVIADHESVRLPARLPALTVELRLGLYSGATRLPVDDSSLDDGNKRVRAGRIMVRGTPLPLPIAEVKQLTTPPLLDGHVTGDPAWSNGPTVSGFTMSRGDTPSRWRTAVYLGWDATFLYVAFTTEDPDIRATYMRHDQPIYREEAVEMFVDARGTGDSYVELQSSPRGVTFDAAFRGGPRRNMDTAYDADFTAICDAHGTLNDASDVDQGWDCEWKIALASIRGVSLPVTADTRWRTNFFRIAKDSGERVPDDGSAAVVADESAWSPPLMGDFHNLERFGTLVFRAPVRDVGQTQ